MSRERLIPMLHQSMTELLIDPKTTFMARPNSRRLTATRDGLSTQFLVQMEEYSGLEISPAQACAAAFRLGNKHGFKKNTQAQVQLGVPEYQSRIEKALIAEMGTWGGIPFFWFLRKICPKGLHDRFLLAYMPLSTERLLEDFFQMDEVD